MKFHVFFSLHLLLCVFLNVSQCYMFHMYVGVRAGGGIGDQIEDPAGDEYEIYRIIFDITFFFFVIVILLAIIQGERSNCHTHTHTQSVRYELTIKNVGRRWG